MEGLGHGVLMAGVAAHLHEWEEPIRLPVLPRTALPVRGRNCQGARFRRSGRAAGSGPLLPRAVVSVLDLDQFGTGRNLAVDEGVDLDLVAGTLQALCGISN